MNRRTWGFHLMLSALPAHIQQQARAAFATFRANPQHPALRLHALAPKKKGQHLPGSFSVSVTINYRAIYTSRDGVNVWYWIGSHADYDAFIGRK